MTVTQVEVENDDFKGGQVIYQDSDLIFERINGKLCFWAKEYPKNSRFSRDSRNYRQEKKEIIVTEAKESKLRGQVGD